MEWLVRSKIGELLFGGTARPRCEVCNRVVRRFDVTQLYGHTLCKRHSTEARGAFTFALCKLETDLDRESTAEEQMYTAMAVIDCLRQASRQY